MRIAIAGSSNCGKTTLAKGLAAALGVEPIPEFFGEPFAATPDLTPEQEAVRFETIFEKKAALEDGHADGFISDRSPIDLAYAWLIRALPLRFEKRSREFLTRCRERMQTYDAVIFPPGPAPDRGTENYYGKPDRIWEMWRNHNAMIGLALGWVPQGRLFVIPDQVTAPDARVEWAVERCGLVRKESR